MEIQEHLKWLNDHVSQKIAIAHKDPAPLHLKLEHTRQVLKNIEEIAKTEKFIPLLAKACALGAIYHDLARFDQYLFYGTFRDTQSRNHAAWAVQLVKRHNRMREEEPSVRRMSLTAIAVHNRREVPSSLHGATLMTALALRDADKLDILRVMAQHLGQNGPYNPTVVLSLPDRSDLHSRTTIADTLANRPASYSDLQSVNDFRLLLGTWVFSMNFPSSKRKFAESPDLRAILAGLSQNSAYDQAYQHIQDYISNMASQN